jgi:hypothetical protein
MSVAVLDPRSSLEMLREELVYTLSKVEANAHTKAFAAAYVALLARWEAVAAKERSLRDAVTRARAAVDQADDVLDTLVDMIVLALLAIVKNDRTAPLWLQFFKNKTPYELKRPLLAEELEAVREWLGWLATSQFPTLLAFQGPATEAVAAGDLASKMRRDAEAELAAFRLTGDRMALFDEANAQRKSDFGEFSKLPFTLVTEGLPKTFGDIFFLHESNKPKAVTLVTVTKRVSGLLDDALAAKKDLDKVFALDRAEAAASEAIGAMMGLAKKLVEAAQGLADALKGLKK